LQPAAARKLLKQMPTTLEGIYDKILSSLPEENQKVVQAALLLLAFSARPMTIQEVAEAVAINVEEQSFSTDERPIMPESIFEVCPSLIFTYHSAYHLDRRLKDKEEIGLPYPQRRVEYFLQLSHYTVKEYIISEKMTKNPLLSQFHVCEAAAHRYLAEACLIYLLDFNSGSRFTYLDLEAFPFLAYAARYWYHHWQFIPTGKDQTVCTSLIQRLFDVHEPNSYINWLNVCDPISPECPGPLCHRAPAETLDSFRDPLYYAAAIGHLEACQWLLERFHDTEFKMNLDKALKAAAYSGSLAIVKLLLDRGANVNINSEDINDLNTALQAAAYMGHKEVLEVLLDHGADADARGGGYQTALIAAAHRGHSDAVKVLLERGADQKIESVLHGSPLHAAAMAQHVGAVKLLFKHGENSYDTAGRALHAAAESGAVDLVRLFLRAGADINWNSGEYGTALYTACASGHTEVAKLLLEAGADVNMQEDIYRTALQGCIENRDLEMLQMFLDRGADIDAVGGEYGSPLRAAILLGNLPAAKILLDRGAIWDDDIFLDAVEEEAGPIIRELLRRGANPNAQNKDGSALQIAISNCDWKTTDWLLRFKKLDIDARGRESGETALYDAIATGNESLVRQLIERGADVNARGSKNGSPLGMAVTKENEELVRLLIEEGADVNATGGWYGTSLIAAAHKGNLKLVELLLAHGADVNAPGARRGGVVEIEAASRVDSC
jgi:ankyrin repeat protein